MTLLVDLKNIEEAIGLCFPIAIRSDMHDAALRLVQPLLNDLSHHFRRFCRTSAVDYFGLLCKWQRLLADKSKLTYP